MPYVGEHSAPQIDPSKFDKFRRVHETLAPDGIDFIYGFKDGGSEIQSVRADAEIWTVEAFRKWLGDHELTDQYLKPAIDEEVEAGYKDKGKDKDKEKSRSEEYAKHLRAGSKADDRDQSKKAAPDERIEGSDKNKEGTASDARGGIKVSETTEVALRNKIEEHNKEVGDVKSKRANLGMLKAVYRRGSGAFSSSHRSGMTRGQWAMARVNHFLHILKTGKPKDPKYVTDNDLLPEGHPRKPKSTEASRTVEFARYRLPMFIRQALAKGLTLHDEGKSGAGLTEQTIRDARKGSSSGEWDDEKILRADAWFERHAGDRKLDGRRRWNTKGSETPGFVAWLLWGSDANDRGRAWIKNKAKEIREEREAMEEKETVEESREQTVEATEELAFDNTPGDPLAEYRDPDGMPAPLMDKKEIELEKEKDLHVMRLGELYDLDSGKMILNLSESMARELAETTQRLIESGHQVPLSFEHGIEGGNRGDEGSDRRPYGEILSVYYDEARRGIYARKKLTSVGKGLLLDSMTEGGRSALRVSPRVKFKPAFHPNTGMKLGSAYMDVVSLTTLPRQAGLDSVSLSRGTIICEEPTPIPAAAEVETAEIATTKKEPNMKAEKTETTVEVLLARGSEEARQIYKAAGLEEGAEVVELARILSKQTEELSRLEGENNKFREEELARTKAAKEAEVEDFLGKHEIADVEKEFFRASLLSADETTAELARNTLIARGTPDPAVAVGEAIEAAKVRGAVPADFKVEDIQELSRDTVDATVRVLNAIPGNTVVNTSGEPKGSDVPGTEAEKVGAFDKESAGIELSRLARVLVREGKASGLMEAHTIVLNERQDLEAAIKEK